MEDFSRFLVREYQYWSLNVHHNQGYLGRCVVWCKREDALDLADATEAEREELFMILAEVKEALETAFSADWINYAFLGNEARHLHGHIIPRYEGSREFAGMKFVDERWGHNYQTDRRFQTPNSLIEEVKRELKKHLK